MSEGVKVQLRGTYVSMMLDQLEKQSQHATKQQKAPGMAVELVMAQFVAAGMFLCKHVNPKMVEELYAEMMTSRHEIEKSISDTMIDQAVKESIKNGS